MHKIHKTEKQKAVRTGNWLIGLAVIIILLGLLGWGSLWVRGRYLHHQAIEEFEKIRPAISGKRLFHFKVTTTDTGLRSWLCRRFDGKLTFLFERVEEIAFRCINLTPHQLQLLELFPETETVFLQYCNITDSDLAYLSKYSNLKKLGLTDIKITDKGLAHLSEFTDLESLDLSHTNITDAGLVHLSGLKKLTELSIFGTQVTETGINDLKKKLPNLKKVDGP